MIAESESDKLLSLKIKRRLKRMRPKSKVAGASSRRNPIEDDVIFQLIRASIAKGHDTILDAGSKPLVPKWKDKIYLKNKEENEETGKETRTIWVPDWTHTGDRLKLLALGASMTGEAYAFTLRLGKREIEAAYASPRGFVGYFTERMKRSFHNAGDPSPQYAFIVEATALHEEHLHGIVSSTVTNLRPVLAKVGGDTDMKAKERQVHTKKIFNLLGWAEYIAKAPLRQPIRFTGPERKDRSLRGRINSSVPLQAYGAQPKSGTKLNGNLESLSLSPSALRPMDQPAC